MDHKDLYDIAYMDQFEWFLPYDSLIWSSGLCDSDLTLLLSMWRSRIKDFQPQMPICRKNDLNFISRFDKLIFNHLKKLPPKILNL